MNYLITGISGFIGFHTALALKKRGETVFGIDNFNPYYDVELKKNRASILQKLGIEVVQEDLCTPSKTKAWIFEGRVDKVIHLAAQAGVRYASKNPMSYIKSNVEALTTLLEIVAKKPHIPLLFASSSSVYGQNQDLPYQENKPTDHPSSLYAATKKSGELICHAYHHIYGLKIACLRFFTVYGPFGRPDMAYFSFTKAIDEKKPITLYGQGLLQRDFTYIDDIVEGIIGVQNNIDGYEIYNLGGSHTRKVIDLIRIIENTLGKKAHIQEEASPKEDAVCTWADVEKSRREFGFSPKISLEEGIPRFIEWYKDYYK